MYAHTPLPVAVELEIDICDWFCSERYIHKSLVPEIHLKVIDHICSHDNNRNIIV